MGANAAHWLANQSVLTNNGLSILCPFRPLTCFWCYISGNQSSAAQVNTSGPFVNFTQGAITQHLLQTVMDKRGVAVLWQHPLQPLSNPQGSGHMDPIKVHSQWQSSTLPAKQSLASVQGQHETKRQFHNLNTLFSLNGIQNYCCKMIKGWTYYLVACHHLTCAHLLGT